MMRCCSLKSYKYFKAEITIAWNITKHSLRCLSHNPPFSVLLTAVVCFYRRTLKTSRITEEKQMALQ